MAFLDYIEQDSALVFNAEFAEPAVYTPAGGAARDVIGIFDRVSEISDIAELLAAEGVAATYNVHTPDFTDVSRGDAMTVRGYAYKVVGIEPDGTGRTVLVLGV